MSSNSYDIIEISKAAKLFPFTYSLKPLYLSHFDTFNEQDMLKFNLALAFSFALLSGCNASSLIPKNMQSKSKGAEESTLTYTVMPDQDCPSKYNNLPLINEQTVHSSAKLCFY